MEILRARKRMNDAVRSWFDARGFLEVETPIAVVSPGLEPHLFAFETTEVGPDDATQQLFLHTSPEYAMKRMLGRGVGSIYQLARVFRNGERSATHAPEFTMLEWYREGEAFAALMDDVEGLFGAVAEAVGGWRPSRVERVSVSEAFVRAGLVDPVGVLEHPAGAAAAPRHLGTSSASPLAGGRLLEASAKRPGPGPGPDSAGDEIEGKGKFKFKGKGEASRGARGGAVSLPSSGKGEASRGAGGGAASLPSSDSGPGPGPVPGPGDSLASAALRIPDADDTAALREALGVRLVSGDDWDDVFFRAFLDHVEPTFADDTVTILYGYPAHMAALARIDPNDPRVAERFEVFVGRTELGNAFGELTDPVEQRARFELDLAHRRRLGRPAYPIDEGLLEDLGNIEAAAGIAVGLDRLLMCCLQLETIQETLVLSPLP